MSSVKKKITLSKDALELFKLISSKKKINISDIQKEQKIDRGKLEYLLGFLISNNLVKKNPIIKEKIILTKEGEIAAKEQLVERRIVAQLKKQQPLHLTELANKINCNKKELNAGIGLLKKKGLIEIQQGNVSLLKSEVDISEELQRVLEEILQGKEPDVQKVRNILLQRNLVSFEEIKDILLQSKIAYDQIKNQIQIEEGISRLTPAMIRNGTWKKQKLKAYNMSVSPPSFYLGRKQPYAQFLDDVKRKLTALGFLEMRGPIVELEFWNFDALFQAQDHPAREWSDVYRVANPKIGKLPKESFVKGVQKAHENGFDTGSKGWRYKWDPKKSARLVLRAQGTSVSARTLVNLPTPSKFFSISRCYRPDTVDATHLSEFNQVEGIVADPSITFRDLLGILKTFALDIAEAPTFRFKPDYYPFTEPSVELSVIDPNLGKIEFGGAGIFRPEVTKPFGIDVPIIAWGLGIDRLFMVKYGITDIRELFSYKLEWLRSAKAT
ncbi:MAG: phenylalanine--tRNA ligase subunit alpha [Candidatus Heimdallarchaeaceae archaeon]